MFRKTIVIGAAVLAMCGSAFTQSTNQPVPVNTLSDHQAFCDYVTQQAMAQRDLLLMPRATAGVTQPDTGLPMQMVWGISSSLSDVRKAGLTMDAARKDCDLYGATMAAQRNIQYALPVLEKQALQHRLALIQQASGKLDGLIAGTREMVDAQNLTRPMLFALQSSKIKLEADRADTQGKIAALYAPDLAATPLKQLVAEKQAGEAKEQSAIEKLNRQNNWDVSLSIGVHQQINPPSETPAPYGAVTVRYNLASGTINKHLSQATGAYTDWKSVQEGDVVRNAEILRKQVTDSISAQRNRLESLKAAQQQVQSNLLLVADTDTGAAIDFRNQLTSAQLLVEIEIGDASFRLTLLRDFLENNY